VRAPSGVIDYQPTEFIIQAYAGTPVREINALLAAQGQYLPFDPLLVESGATLGGTVAANAAGPERFRYGGVRDFIVGCHYLDGQGELLGGGGKVVKNAAGFDYPKLLVGSRGALALLVDVCFKVFPAPETYHTLRARFSQLDLAVTAANTLAGAPLDIHALDIACDSEAAVLEVRVGGLRDGIAERMKRVQSAVRAGHVDMLTGDVEAAHWHAIRELAWFAKTPLLALLKVPITPSLATRVDAALAPLCSAARRYSAAANAGWYPIDASALSRAHDALASIGMRGQVFAGAQAGAAIGAASAPNPFAERIRAVLDPEQVFAQPAQPASAFAGAAGAG
jgi:glycolate oxidase FAD binding subunit